MDPERLNILIVDDEKHLLTLYQKILQEGGHTVTTALTAQAAMASLEVQDVDVIISDFVLPGLDGLDLLKWVRETGKDPYFVVISGYYNESFSSHFLMTGADEILAKPVSVQQLHDILDHANAKRATARSTESKPVRISDDLPSAGEEVEHRPPVELPAGPPPDALSDSWIEDILGSIGGIAGIALIDLMSGNTLASRTTVPRLQPGTCGQHLGALISFQHNVFRSLDRTQNDLDDMLIVSTEYFHLFKFLPDTQHLLYVILLKQYDLLGTARLEINKYIASTPLFVREEKSRWPV